MPGHANDRRHTEFLGVLPISLRALLEMREDDLRSALEYLKEASRDTQHPFFEALDFERVGIFGHSMGGLQMDVRVRSSTIWFLPSSCVN